MATIEKRTFRQEELVVDGNSYVGCIFDGCSLKYCGGIQPKFEDCKVLHSELDLQGSAARTVEFLRQWHMVYPEWCKAFVEKEIFETSSEA